jgi:hypothetical protein
MYCLALGRVGFVSGLIFRVVSFVDLGIVSAHCTTAEQDQLRVERAAVENMIYQVLGRGFWSALSSRAVYVCGRVCGTQG